MKTENMPTENRALNARLLLIIAKQRKKLFSMNRNLKSCEENLNQLLEFKKTECDFYRDYEKGYWELSKKYLESLEKIAYLERQVKDFETDINSFYSEKDLLEKSKRALIKQIKKL